MLKLNALLSYKGVAVLVRDVGGGSVQLVALPLCQPTLSLYKVASCGSEVFAFIPEGVFAGNLSCYMVSLQSFLA